MAKWLEQVAIVNSAVRTVLALVVVGGLGFTGWYGYATYHQKDRAVEAASRELEKTKLELDQSQRRLQEKERAIESLRAEVDRQRREIERLDTAMRLLKVDHRIARLVVLDQTPDDEGHKLVSLVEFQEVNDEGAPIGAPKQFRIAGDLVYVDAWVVKFDDKYIEEAAIDRATSLVLFRRIFGEAQKPMDGYVLDETGARPTVYGRGGEPSELERKIWGDFWSVANDERRQAEMGIRAAHGEAPSIKVQKGKSYRLELRSSGGLTIINEGDAPARHKPEA